MSATRQPIHDDRYVSPLESSRRGAHRARSNPILGYLPHIAISLVLVVAVFLGVKLGLGSLTSNTDSTPAIASTAGAGAGNQSQPTPSAAQSASAPTTTAAPQQSQTSQAPAGGTADFAASVKVMNGTATPKLASKGAKALVTAGWKKAVAAFGTPTNKASAVYYATKAQKPNADAIAAALGFTTVTKDATIAATGIVVVVGKGYTG
jgi:hypothetical protein